MDSQFCNSIPPKVTEQKICDILEPKNPFEYAAKAVPDRPNPPTARMIRRRKCNSESEDKQVLLALDLASLLSCSTNDDRANVSKRRKAQNRASQRAFRERKRSHVEDLQKQLDKLHETYRVLQEIYQQSVNEFFNMRSYAEELSFEIAMLQMKPETSECYFDGIKGTTVWRTAKLESLP
jgi:chromosome segregation ATPase